MTQTTIWASALISSREISGGSECRVGSSETERVFFLRACGGFRSTMQKHFQHWVGVLVGGHIAGCRFTGMLPVPRSHHGSCCSPRCLAAHPLHTEEIEAHSLHTSLLRGTDVSSRRAHYLLNRSHRLFLVFFSPHNGPVDCTEKSNSTSSHRCCQLQLSEERLGVVQMGRGAST